MQGQRGSAQEPREGCMEMEARTRATKSRASACSPSKHDADKHSRYSSLVHCRDRLVKCAQGSEKVSKGASASSM